MGRRGLRCRYPGLRERYLRPAEAWRPARCRMLADRSADAERNCASCGVSGWRPSASANSWRPTTASSSRAEAAEIGPGRGRGRLSRCGASGTSPGKRRRSGSNSPSMPTIWRPGAWSKQNEVESRCRAEAIRERCRRERAEAALRLFADRAEVMPKEGWASELAKANRDIPLWWFHAARVALDPPEPSGGSGDSSLNAYQAAAVCAAVAGGFAEQGRAAGSAMHAEDRRPVDIRVRLEHILHAARTRSYCAASKFGSSGLTAI